MAMTTCAVERAQTRLPVAVAMTYFALSGPRESKLGEKLDTIIDFERGSDIVDLSAIDARDDKSGNQTFTFIGRADFSGKSGELRFKNGTLEAETDGDARSDFEVAISDIARMGESDFVL
jgi:hypothetical protein